MQHTPRSFSNQAASRHVANQLFKGRSATMDASHAHPLADKAFTRYFFLTCPRTWECTDAAWKRCKYCESYKSEHEARTLLLQHLVKSGRHRDNAYWKLWDSAQRAELCQEEVPGHWFDEAPGPAVGELVTPLVSM